MRFLVTRPEPDATQQANELRHRGHEVVVAPMLAIELRKLEIDDDSVDIAGFIVTSRNALRAIERYSIANRLLSKPIYCVGPDTAKMAHSLRFRDVVAGSGNAEDLVRLIRQRTMPDVGAFLRLTGEIPSETPYRLSTELAKAGYAVSNVICYEVTAATKFGEDVRRFLADDRLTCIILMSPLTAKSFQSCLGNDGLTVQSENFRYICMSDAVADALGCVPPAHIFVADKPNRAGLGSILDRAVADLS